MNSYIKSLKFIFVAAILFAPLASFAHAHLKSAEPAPESVISAKLSEVTLHFSESLEVPLCSVDVVKFGSKDLLNTKELIAVGDDTKTLKVNLKDFPVVESKIQVNWKVVSKDGHKMQGSYQFTFKPVEPKKK